MQHLVRAAVLTAAFFGMTVNASAEEARLMRRPTVSRDLIAFSYGSDLWVVPRSGGQARRLTMTPTVETDPYFSPDGSQIAFTATVGSNTDVYVLPASATPETPPKRLTFHPGVDAARGWSPDGRVLFASERDAPPSLDVSGYLRLWKIGPKDGLPQQLAMPRAYAGAFSPDGRLMAYQLNSFTHLPTAWGQNQTSGWRDYRGGRVQPIRIMNLVDHSEQLIPWTDSNDGTPMWLDQTIYFLSDRAGAVNLFAYRTDTKALTQLTRHEDDIMSASAGAGAVVYEQGGYIHLFDVKTGVSRRVPIEIAGQFPWADPQTKKVARLLQNTALSPSGDQIAVEARGEIFTMPAQKGEYRNITRSPGANDRSPAWSPDGKRLAWFSDASGEYQLMIGEASGEAKPQAIAVPSQGFFSTPHWSPDGKYVLFYDNGRRLWLADVAGGRVSKLDDSAYYSWPAPYDATWSPDSRWIAFSKTLANRLRGVFLYSLREGRTVSLSGELVDAIWPVFDASGKYLYMLASTNYGPKAGGSDTTAVDRPVRRGIYVVVLAKDGVSPLLPTADGKPDAAAQAQLFAASGAEVHVDLEGIEQRIVPVNVPIGDFTALQAGPAGSFLYAEPTQFDVMIDRILHMRGPAPLRVQRYSFEKRASEPVIEGIRSFTVSADGKRLLYKMDGNRWGVVSSQQPSKVGDGEIDIALLEARVEPRAEWAQMYREAWRQYRDYFYDEHMHGVDWKGMYEKYLPLVAHVRHQADLAYLIATLNGELMTGHSYVSGGGEPGNEAVGLAPLGLSSDIGLLGADLGIENGHYRLTRIYGGEIWNPDLQPPLAVPGLGIEEGQYLLEVNGKPLAAPTNFYSAFVGTAGKPTQIRVSATPSGKGSRLVTIVPIASEVKLRARAWIEHNRRLVDRLSGGRLAYVWLPNTSGEGLVEFTRYYYAQQDKQGAIIDDRFNHGGMIPDFYVRELSPVEMSYFAPRNGAPFPETEVGIRGPKVMLVNESAGSGGDMLPYSFRQRGLGPLVGMRTWGGVIGTNAVPPLMDGTSLGIPVIALFDLTGHWAVENEGVAPDIIVENEPAELIKGHDSQLERAVEEALRLLEQHPPHPSHPPWPARERLNIPQ